MEIALAAGSEPIVLPSDIRLGSEKRTFKDFGAIEKGLMVALAECNGSVIKATKAVLTHVQLAELKLDVALAIMEACNLDGNVILGTHNPFWQMGVEEISGVPCNIDIPELAWVVFEMIDNKITIIESSVDLGLNL